MIDIVAVASLGGIARAKKLTPEQRSASCSNAAKARWKRYRAAKRAAARSGVAA
jgi:hypothetical protein